VRTGGNAVIRQAISCDICGTEKKQTNHWFVAYDQGGELRVSGWNSRNRLRPGAKHLCGQTCLHKLVDEFMAKALRARPTQADSIDAAHEAELEAVERSARSDTSLTSKAAFIDDVESSARLIPTPARVQARAPMELVSAPAKPHAEEAAPAAGETPRYTSRNWRAAAWERERERELRADERHPGLSARRRLGS
jgi:hypothetical protein